MITRGIIEKSIDKYHVKVRIPSVDRVNNSPVHTSTDNLNTAVLATLPGCEVHLQPGDVVIVSMEEAEDNVTILGYLYRSESVQKYCSQNLDTLNVAESAVLSKNTTIGEVKPDELSQLTGIRENIQQQLDELEKRLQRLEES